MLAIFVWQNCPVSDTPAGMTSQNKDTFKSSLNSSTVLNEDTIKMDFDEVASLEVKDNAIGKFRQF